MVPPNGSFLRTASLIVVYLSSNISMNMLNRWMLGLYPFPYPLFMTLCHMLFQFVVFFPSQMADAQKRAQHRHNLEKQGRGLLAIGLTFAANISLNNFSLVSLPLSMNQIIRSSMPVVVALLAWTIESRRASGREMVALVALCTGVSATVYEQRSSESTALGATICVLSVFACAVMMCTSGIVMKEKVDAIQLSFYTSPISALVMLPICMVREGRDLSAYFDQHGYSVLGLMLVSCLISVLYNVVHSMMIHVTTSTTTTVIGQVKVVLLLIFGALFLGESKVFTPRVLAGCVLAMVGFAYYSHLKLQRQAASKAFPESPEASEPQDSRTDYSSSMWRPLAEKRYQGGSGAPEVNGGQRGEEPGRVLKDQGHLQVALDGSSGAAGR